MNLLKGLNENQKKAVLHSRGPLLIIAGAGTGKTKVITHRISNLIKQGVNPKHILAVTFTNKAAQEMAERICNLMQIEATESPTVGTFHAIAANILRKHGDCVDINPHFSILDEKESLEIIKSSIEELKLNLRQFRPQNIQNLISQKKSQFDGQPLSGDFFPTVLGEIKEKYDECLKKQNALDFDDLIQKTVFLFEQKPEILKIYQGKWPYIHIDEYQDTDNSQYRLIRLLSRPQGNICAVGDDDQSIYGFRGANFTNILNFEKTWPDAEIIILERNYRSSQKILYAANAIIAKNEMRRPKSLYTRRKKGVKITSFEAKNEKEEAEFIAKQIKNLLQKPLMSEIAVLCRLNSQFSAFEKVFQECGLPFQAASNQDSLLIEQKKPIRLMTIHAAKGLEFKNVFIPGLEKGLFPCLAPTRPYFNGEKEEERRLFYVALTRAQEKVFLSWCRFRTVFGTKQINQPSQFLEDIPKNLMKWL
jgi:DNA helicase-2/ATP-dependent DNA helicase PcrA